MVPLEPAAARYIRTWLGPFRGPGLLALRHAVAYRRPGLWGDSARAPRSVVLLREGDGQLEAFGAGEPEPAVGWLVGQARGFILHAPESWDGPVRDRLGAVDEASVETWSAGSASGPAKAPPRSLTRPRLAGPPAADDVHPAAPRVATRRLEAGDDAAFQAGIPPWALRGWRTFPALIEHGVAFGVPHGPGFAALAWTFDQADIYDAVGVYCAPRFRRLGLARAVASTLIDHVVNRRGRIPLWSLSTGDGPSGGLARALGFSVTATESLLRWPPRAADDART